MIKGVGFVICTRTDSERLPNKPFRLINGKSVIEHLIHRLKKCNIPIYLAIPEEQKESYAHLSKIPGVNIFPSKHYDDPLKRMTECAIKNNLSSVIRVSHDKIFIDHRDVNEMLEIFNRRSLDYVYGTKFISGTGFEIISLEALKKASKKYEKIEYIGYSIRAVTNNILDYTPKQQRNNTRLLIDYPEDLKLLEVIMSTLGNDCTIQDVLRYINNNPELKYINNLPILTVYTCAYNSEKFIEKCMDSVSNQKCFSKFEYVLIDDCSKDKTCELMAKFALKYSNVRWFRNEKNMGLASSSNIALRKAKGKYILRLDSDDFFVSISSLFELVKEIENSGCDVIYPNNYFGDLSVIQQGKDSHHCGGAIFNRQAIEHLKFKDGLMGHDSLDIFLRAKEQLKVGYINKPMFFYTQREDSMSKTNLKMRADIKSKILSETISQDVEDFFNEDVDVQLIKDFQ